MKNETQSIDEPREEGARATKAAAKEIVRKDNKV